MVTDTGLEVPLASSAPVDSAEGPRGGAARRFSISGDVIARATAQMPDDAREAVKWLAGYCITKNLSHREVAPRIKKANGVAYSVDSIYSLFVGRREVDQLGPLVEAINLFRRQVEENLLRSDTDFIETAVSRKIWALCDKARARRKIVLLYAESQIGKTTNLIVYKEAHNHGETKLFSIPNGRSINALVNEIAMEVRRA